MNEDDIEYKQNFLRTQIIDEGYEPEEFSKFLSDEKGDIGLDLNNWKFEDLKNSVIKFKSGRRRGAAARGGAGSSPRRTRAPRPRARTSSTRPSRPSPGRRAAVPEGPRSPPAAPRRAAGSGSTGRTATERSSTGR